MKVFFRILFIFVSIGIVVYAALPPSDRQPKEKPPTTTEEIAEDGEQLQSADSSLIRDLLGGSQIDAGKKAKEVLNEVNQDRQEDLEEFGLE